jgi:hypothetical protein
MEFKSDLDLKLNECFRITQHDGTKSYPTRMKVVAVSAEPEYTGNIVTIIAVNTEVEPF